VSRDGASDKRKARAAPAAGTPIWVWAIYALGIFAVVVFGVSTLFTAGALFLSNDVPVSARFSAPAAIVWGGLIMLAGVTWFMRRRRR
jgi:LPXTG-motif cell wall-anchored protein